MTKYTLKQLFWKLKVILKTYWKKSDRAFVYVAIGDSTVEGTGATHPQRTYTHLIYASILQTYKNATYHNLGKKGAPIREVIEEQLNKAVSYKPNLITISVGANDIRLHTKLNNFERDLNHLIEKLQTETDAQIVINNIPDFSVTKAVPARLKPIAKVFIGKFNQIIFSTAKKTGIIYVDLHTQSKIYTKFYPEIVSAEDEFHPSDFGYALWANTILTSIQHILLPKNHSEIK